MYLPLFDTSEINHRKGFVKSRQQPCAKMNHPVFYLAAARAAAWLAKCILYLLHMNCFLIKASISLTFLLSSSKMDIFANL